MRHSQAHHNMLDVYDAACTFIGQEVELTPTEIPHPDDIRLVQNYFVKAGNRLNSSARIGR